MKRALATWAVVGLIGLTPALAPAANAPGSSPNPVLELQNQDAALSLLLEAFRQAQTSLIQADYDSRLLAANSLTEAGARRSVALLADLERDLRTEKLTRQLRNLLRAYECARRDDEHDAGLSVPSAVDLEAAATRLRDFRFVKNDPRLQDSSGFIAADFETPVFSSGSSPSPLPPQFRRYLSLLSGHCTNDQALVAAVDSLLRRSRQQTGLHSTDPALMAISYRIQDGQATNVVIQLFGYPKQPAENPVANTRLASSRLGPDVLSPIDLWLNTLTEPQIDYLGAPSDVRQRQRAFQSALQADLTLMREQTVEPLQLIVLMPDPGQFLPQCLSHRVRAAIIEASLASNEWSCRAFLVAPDRDAAEQVGMLLAGWRDIAMSLVDIYAGSEMNRLSHRALETSSVQVNGNEALASGSTSSSLGVRALTKLVRWSVEEAPGDDEVRMVTICSNGQTVQVPARELSPNLAKGAHIGPCP